MTTINKVSKKITKLPQPEAEAGVSKETAKMIERVVKRTVKNRKGSRTHEYFLYRFYGYPATVASSLTGYHPGSGSRLEKRYRDDAKFRAEIDRIASPAPGRYQTWAKLQLPQVSKIESAALDKMLSDPEMAIRHPKLLRDLKQASGVELNEVQKPVVQHVNIGAIQQNILQTLEGNDSPDTVDVIEVESEAPDK